MAIRCYKYWAAPASKSDADSLHGQCRLAGDYRRALVDIENRKRALQRALWATPMRDVAFDDRKGWRDGGGNKVLKEWTGTDEYKLWRTAFQKASFSAVKIAYATAGEARLAWGTRLAVGEAVDHARRTTEWANDLRHSACHRVAVQIQLTRPLSGLAVMDGEDTRLRIGRDLYALGENIDGYRVRAVGEFRGRSGQVRDARLREAKIRIGSDGRDPIWASLHVLMHRPLPDGQIKGAWAQRFMVAGRWKWELVVSIDIGERIAVAHPAADGTCAIDLGWRRRSDGMRVAYWTASDGSQGEVVIPIHVERRKAKSDDLHSIRDNRRNELAAALRTWVEDHRGTWLDDALVHVGQWTRIGHFVKLERLWREQRVADDSAPYERLVAFLLRDRHLHAWQANNLLKMKRQIRGEFDAFAHAVCAKYGVVAIEKLSLVRLRELDDNPINARSIQRLAPGELLLAIKQASSKYGCVVHEIDPAYTTLTCTACGLIREVQDQARLVLTCDGCGHADDQDRTAALNLLRASAGLRDIDGRPLDAKKTATSTKKMAPRRTRKRVVDQSLDA